MAHRPGVNVRTDGSIDLDFGRIRLERLYPCVDASPVRATAVEAFPGGMRLRTEDQEFDLLIDPAPGVVRLRLSVACAGRLPFRTGLCGRVRGADRAWVQGLGFSGPSGTPSLASPEAHYLKESYLATALVADGSALAMYATDHRRFLQQTSIRNRTSRRGLVNRHLESEDVQFEAAFLTESVPGGGKVELPTLTFRVAGTLDETLASAATDIAADMRVALTKPARWHYCSWYRRHSHFTLDDLRRWLGEHAASGLDLQAVQIDDGYQAASGDWLEPSSRFPGGLEVAFAEIARAGLTPGVWVAPFMVESRSRLFREHPDWVVRTRDGKPWAEWTRWDGEAFSEEHYCLDATHPAVVEYLGSVFRQMHRWGARVFKTDFLDWGLKDTAHAVRYNPDKTSVEAYRDVLAAIREAIGPESYWLACIAPYAPLLGFADGIRIANDVGTRWTEGGTGNLVRESIETHWFHARLFENDPDALYFRNVFNALTDDEVRAIACWVGVLGLSVNASEFPSEVPEHRLRLWKWLRPAGPLVRGEIVSREGVLIAVRRYGTGGGSADDGAGKGGGVGGGVGGGSDARAGVGAGGGSAVVAFNPDKHPRPARLDLPALAGMPGGTAWLWDETGTRPSDAQLLLNLPPHSALVFYVSPNGTPPPPGMTLGGYLPT